MKKKAKVKKKRVKIKSIIIAIAPMKNEIIEIFIMLLKPKNKPRAPMSFTSPIPIASFPEINPPSNVINKNITPPVIIPSILFNASVIPDWLNIPSKKVNNKPISKIVKTSLFGIICSLKSIKKAETNNGNNTK